MTTNPKTTVTCPFCRRVFKLHPSVAKRFWRCSTCHLRRYGQGVEYGGPRPHPATNP